MTGLPGAVVVFDSESDTVGGSAAPTALPMSPPRVMAPAPLAKRTLADLEPIVCGEKRTTAVQVPMLAIMPVQVVDSS